MRVQLETTSRLLVVDPKPMGSGGEANIHQIPEQPHLVAKIYHKPSSEHAEKLTAMLAAPPVDPMAGTGHISIAWPTGRLLSPDGDHPVIGYLMPKVEQARLLQEFYNPKSRLQTCPLFHYGYLMRTARNLAAAVRAVHDRGYVVGDLNERNLLVTTQALVALVDTDSFQVQGPTRMFRCRVGTPEYTPPELQGARFADVDRGPEHDVFGLGVLIFQLLMQGLHPFAGVFIGKGESGSIPGRIAQGHWPYSKIRKVPLKPNPHAPPWDVLPPVIQDLFLRCFDEGHAQPSARPSAATWQRGIRDAEDQLRSCPSNLQHRFYRGLETCPWCKLAAQQQRDPFPSPAQVQAMRHTQRLPTRLTRVKETDIAVKGAAQLPGSTDQPPAPPKKPIQHEAPSAGVDVPGKPSEDGDVLEALPVENEDSLQEMGLVVARKWRTTTWLRWGVGAATAILVLVVAALIVWAVIRRELTSGLVQRFEGHQGDITSVAFSPDGKQVLSGGADRTLRLWDAASGKEVHRFPDHGDWIRGVCFSGDGQRALSASVDKMVRLWDVPSGRELNSFRAASGLILAVNLSADGSRGMSFTGDGSLHIWDVTNGQVEGVQRYPWLVNNVAFATNGDLAVTARGESVAYLRNLSGHEIRRFQGHDKTITSVAVSMDGRRALTGSADRTVRLWDVNTGKELSRLEGHQGEVTSVAFSRDGKYALSGSTDKTVRMWRLPAPS